jgi:pimeloyl-ACP methyl ester carboxylesterase
MQYQLLIAVVLLTVQLLPGVAAAQEHEETNDQMIDLGGFKLHARVSGQGSPAAVFDTGLGDTLDTWGDLPTIIAKNNQVVTYTRAGHGRSEPGPQPRDSRRLAEELHSLLGKLAVPPPYVLVGHSLGGVNIRFFAGLYPDEVAGLVFVDPTTEEMKPRLESEEDRRIFAAQLAQMPPGARAEQEQLAEDLIALAKLGPPPDCPAVVLTSMADPVIPEAYREQSEAMGFTVERLRELQQRAWGYHESLAARFNPGRHVAARESRHYIHHDQPVLVREEILHLLSLISGQQNQ